LLAEKEPTQQLSREGAILTTYHAGRSGFLASLTATAVRKGDRSPDAENVDGTGSSVVCSRKPILILDWAGYSYREGGVLRYHTTGRRPERKTRLISGAKGHPTSKKKNPPSGYARLLDRQKQGNLAAQAGQQTP